MIKMFLIWGDVMNFFPILYKDELLYSGLARYSIRSGNIKEIHNFEDLFGTRNCIASLELPTHIDSLIENMPLNTKYTASYLINNHTLFPFYAAFIQEERGNKIVQTMRNGQGAVSYIRMGLISSAVALNQYIRFCPECFKEDYNAYGESYWHRLHQISGLFICPKHMMPLYNSKELIRAGNRQRYINANRENCVVEREISYNRDFIEKMVWMAEDVDFLLNNNLGYRDQEWFKSQFRVKLIERGYARMNNYIHQKKLKSDFIEFYGEKYLQLMQSEVDIESECWLSSIVRNNNNITCPTRYLMLARFLGIDLETLFNRRLDTYINDIDSDTSIVAEYKDLWDQRLLELIKLDLSIREIAGILKSSVKTIRKSIERLGIEPFWKNNGGGRYIHQKYVETKEFEEKKKEFREKWLQLHIKYTEKSSNQIRKDNDGVYAWLKKYDNEWLEDNYRRISKATTRVDWESRDEELFPKVQNIVGGMISGEPERITWTTIGSKLGTSGWLSKYRDKLPKTKEYIERVEENLQEFHIRKIKWAIEVLEKENKQITYWSLLEKSGVKERYINIISEEITNILIDKGVKLDIPRV